MALNCRHRFDVTFIRFNGANSNQFITRQPRHIPSPPQAHPSHMDKSFTSASSSFDWYPDTGASHHVTPDIASLTMSNDYTGNDKLVVGNGQGLPITHVGKSCITNQTQSFVLNDVLHVPTITKPLLSVKKFCKDNSYFFEFDDESCFVKDKATKKIHLQGISDNGLYKLQSSSFPHAYLTTLHQWHARLGHHNFPAVKQIIQTITMF